MSATERINYTDALLCLMDKPAKTPSDLAPGAKTRYDDWVVTHINQTLTIHGTVSSASNQPAPTKRERGRGDNWRKNDDIHNF